MDSADEKYLHQLYYNPKHSTAFSSASKLWQYVRLHGRNITKKQLYEWLSKQDVYTSHHPIIHRFARRRVVTRGLNDVWDVDLMDMSNLAKYNDGVHFIAILIDIFSRYLYVEPMKNKTTKQTLTAIKNVFRKSRLQPETFRSDAGKEFIGKDVKEYLADCEIYQQVTRNEKKANYAERVIQTLKKRFTNTCITIKHTNILMCYKSWWKGTMKAIIQGLEEHQQLSTKRMNCKCGLNNTFPRNQTKYKRSSLNFHQVTWFELVEQEVHFPEALDKHTQKNYSK